MLKEKVAIIDRRHPRRGSPAGIARAYAREGARVVVTGRTAERGTAVAAWRIRSTAGGEAVFVASDLTSEDSVRELVQTTVATYERIDVLVNNAAATESIPTGAKPVDQLSTDEFEQGMRVAIYGTFWASKYALPHIVSAGGGSVINIELRWSPPAVSHSARPTPPPRAR